MAFELFVAAKEIQRLNLRRRNPVASDAELERLLGRWLSKADEPLEGPWSLRLGEDLGRTSE